MGRRRLPFSSAKSRGEGGAPRHSRPGCPRGHAQAYAPRGSTAKALGFPCVGMASPLSLFLLLLSLFLHPTLTRRHPPNPRAPPPFSHPLPTGKATTLSLRKRRERHARGEHLYQVSMTAQTADMGDLGLGPGVDTPGGSPADGHGSRVSVAVRVRPLIGQELSERCNECINACDADPKQVRRQRWRHMAPSPAPPPPPPHLITCPFLPSFPPPTQPPTQLVVGKDTRFTFDHVFTQRAAQEDIYNECVGPLVTAHFDGYNATVLAYGQTGSGKTFTMGSASNMKVAESEQGIIPRVIEDVFHNIQKRRQEDSVCVSSYHVSLQFLEIYGEEIKDLLDPLASAKVVIREAQGGGITIVGAREEPAESAEEMMLLLERGTLCRTTGSTLMNTQSSRSHAIFTILLEHRLARKSPTGAGEDAAGLATPSSGQGPKEVRRSKFHFVDLAGSERAKRTGAQGLRLKEGIDINKGLLVLGNVISALGDAKKKGQHVPYRDSKLTRLLQDSLGGNSQTLMIACVSPAEINMIESINALRYANRARNIENKPVVNRDKDSLLIDELRAQVQALAAEVLRLKGGGGASSSPSTFPNAATSDLLAKAGGHATENEARDVLLRHRCEIAETEVQRLTEENRKWRQAASVAGDALVEVTADRDYYRLCLQELGVVAPIPAASPAATPPTKAEKAAAGKKAKKSSFFGEGKQEQFTDVLKPYLAEIEELKTKVIDLEQNKGRLERRMTEDNVVANSRASLLSQMAKSLRGLDFQTLAKMVGDQQLPKGEEGQEQEESELEHQVRLATEEEASVFYRAQQEMSSAVVDLNRGIDLKEKLMKQLQESIKRYEVMRKHYEEKLKLMSEETAAYAAEREKLLHELALLEKQSGKSQKENQQVLLKKIQEKEAQLQAATKKQEELGRLARQAQKTDLQLRQLSDEIQNMKRQRLDLLNRLDGEKKRFQTMLKDKSAEIEVLRRAAKRDAKEIQRLGVAVEKADVARRRQEEDYMRMRAGNAAVTARATTSTRQWARNSGTENASTAKHTAFADKYNKYSDSERKTKRWLDTKIREVAKKEEAAERLASEYQRRMTLLKTKEELELARTRLHQNRQSVRDVISKPLLAMPLEATSVGAVAAALLSEDEEATLEELEERIDACKTQLEYKEDRIRKIETIIDAHHRQQGPTSLTCLVDGSDMAGLEPVRMQVANSCQTLEQSHGVIRILFDMLVSSRRDAKTFGDKVQELEDACRRMNELLEDTQDRFQAEKRLFDERLTHLTLEYEEKISGLIDNTELSGLLLGQVLGDAVSASPLLSTPYTTTPTAASVSSSSPAKSPPPQDLDGANGDACLGAEQYRCMLKLSNERNTALRLQMQQVTSTKDELLGRATELEAREKRAREELRDCQGQLKWLEFELTKIKGEYIKLRAGGEHQSPHSAPCPSGLLQQQQQVKSPASHAQALQAQKLRRMEEEVLGGGWGDEEEGVGEEEDGGAISALDRIMLKRKEGEEEGEDTAWAKDIAEDINRHIKEGKAPPSIMARESVKRALNLPTSPPRAAGAGAEGGPVAHHSIFERLADPQFFTGIHKHVNDDEGKEKRRQAEKIRDREQNKYMQTPASNGVAKPKGGSLAASMYARHVPVSAGVGGASSPGHDDSVVETPTMGPGDDQPQIVEEEEVAGVVAPEPAQEKARPTSSAGRRGSSEKIPPSSAMQEQGVVSESPAASEPQSASSAAASSTDTPKGKGWFRGMFSSSKKKGKKGGEEVVG